MPRHRNTSQDILDQLVLVESGCIEWTGARDNGGYGRVRWNGQMWSVHRLIWYWTHKELPEDMMVCHTCDNRICARAEHLFLGTAADNARDAQVKGRLSAVPYSLPEPVSDVEAKPYTNKRQIEMSVPVPLRRFHDEIA